MRRTLLVVAALVASAAPVSAQIGWESPALVSPVAPAGVSLFLLNSAGGDLGGLATYRHHAGPVGLGYRLAIADDGGPDSELAFAGGIDVSGFLSRGVEGAEVDLVWWSGGGLGIADETIVTVPVGLILGWSGSGGDVILSPYGGGHVNLHISTADGDSIDLVGVLDIGLDLVLPSGWLVRFGASFAENERDALALGVKLPT